MKELKLLAALLFVAGGPVRGAPAPGSFPPSGGSNAVQIRGKPVVIPTAADTGKVLSLNWALSRIEWVDPAASAADRDAFTEGTDSLGPVGGVYNDTLGLDLVEDHLGVVRITRRRAFHINLRDNDGAEVGVAGAPLRIDPTGATTQPVSGTFWQATQPVSLATAPTTPVTGTFWQATQPVSGTFWQATQPVSGTFWQATQPVSLATAPTTPVTGTFWQATQPVSAASGTFASGAIADGADVTLGAKADAKSSATDSTAITAMQVLKQISASVQAPPSQAVTGTFFQATQPVSAASGAFASGSIASGAIASGAIASGAIASGAVASGAFASGSIADGAEVTLGAKADAKSTATDSTAVTAMQVLKQISASVQAPPSQAVTGTFFQATQPVSGASGSFVSGSLADGALTTLGAKTDAKSTATDATSITAMQVLKQISASVQAPPAVTQNINTGRTELRFYATAAASGTTTTETAITLTKSSGISATSNAASWVITSGKKFRITHITFATRGHSTATIQTTTFNLRINASGSVTTSSTPILLSARSATAAVASDWDRVSIPLGEGLEIPGDGTLQFGVTAAATFSTNAPTWDVLILGYEY